ncbi:hypothetical protein [Streptomyces caeruleatus]|uniref:Uncharacterized protein n=1 Tax=Streptomyces caeruleatus TaxID=661399 RepID=A0A101U417_9ACTN|nr:hypothetical protein [Streptomyces caeruleatus]KUO03749.1 hypothetical protein AQJ67_13335 [Streptomyces caeruleatus]
MRAVPSLLAPLALTLAAVGSLGAAEAAAPVAAVSQNFNCVVPKFGWNNNCFTITVPAHKTLRVELRTAQNETVIFKAKGEECSLSLREPCDLWRNTTSEPVVVAVGASSWSTNTFRAEGTARTV